MASNLTPTFDDEFNSLALSGKGNWTPDYPWSNPDGKNEDDPTQSAYYINPNYAPQAAANPFSINNGVLDITIKPTPSSINAAEVNNKPYVSGMLQTASSFSQLYGYFEMKAELPVGDGVGGAFWLLPKDGSWPPEIDVEENLGQDKGTVYQTLHDGTPSNVSNLQLTVPVPGGNVSTGYHTYGVDWEADTTTFYLDGKVTGSFATPAGLHKPMYMILQDNTAGSNPSWGKPVDSSTPFPADFKVDYVRAYASKPDLSSGGSPDPAGATTTTTAVPPPVASPVASPVPTPATVGSGVDTLVLNLSEDAYLGDAQFSVTVDGAPLGAAQSVTALHGQGSEAFAFKGSFGPGAHTVGVSFLNDAYAGPGQDRNLYIDSATFNGAQAEGAATLAGNGTVSFAVAGSAPPPAVATDTLRLSLSEDAYQGDAQCLVTVDGKAVGGALTVAALHAQGQSQSVSIAGQWGAGAHDVGVQFINDAYGGSTSTDRNLYVGAVAFDGQASAAPAAALYSNGTAHFATAASPLVLQLSEDAYQGDAQFTVALDGQALGPAQSVTALHGSGAAQDFGFGAALAAGTHDVAVSFLNDAWGGTTATDRNLYVNAVDVNGAAMPGTAAGLYTTSTQHFSVVVAAHA